MIHPHSNGNKVLLQYIFPLCILADLKKATVLPSAETFSSGGSSSEELGELAKLTANEPASASDGGGSMGGGMGQ